MVTEDSIQFDVTLAAERAAAKGWDSKEWARRAGVSMPTMNGFLRGAQGLKNRTIDEIAKPLGLTAVDLLILPTGKKPKR